MKVQHLRNVPPSVCCAEQIIAFNLAMIVRNEHFADWRNLSEQEKTTATENLVKIAIRQFRNSPEYGSQYNEAAITEALSNGLASYMDNPEIPGRFIPDYQKLGEMFKIETQVE